MRLHVKICGITTPADAVPAVEAGANALGVVFAPSPRRVTLEQAREIRAAVPGVELVGVFVDEAFAEVRRAVMEAGLQATQFHKDPAGLWPRADLTDWEAFRAERALRAVRAVRARSAEALQSALEGRAEAFDQVLLDAYVPGVEGGTGQTFDWSLADTARAFGRPIIVAGGLHPGNVAEAIRRVAPWGVDVSSGVESAPGRKDADAVRRFLAAAREAAAAT